MKKKSIFIAVLLLVLAILLPAIALADFGDYTSDSDYGGSWDSGWDSSWDSGSSDGGTIFLGGGSGGIIIAIVILLLVLWFLSKRGKKDGSGRPGGARTAASKLRLMAEYNAIDPNFNPQALQTKLSNLYVQMQNTWQNKDITPVRPYFTDALYAQMERQLEALKKSGQTNYIARIAVLSTTLNGWYQEGGNDCIVASLRTRITDYTLEDATGKLVRGSKDKELFMEYEWTLMRPSGKDSAARKDKESVLCPHCGAPLAINESAKCSYCGSTVTVKDHDWAISAIKGISQRTGG